MQSAEAYQSLTSWTPKRSIMFDVVTVVLALLLLIIPLLYFYWTINFDYWKKKGIPHPPYSLLFGHVTDIILARRSLAEVIQEVYTSYEDLNYVGIYKVRRPGIVVRDAKLAKTILVKEFSSFHDNDMLIHEKADIFSENLFVLRGEKWKSRRQELKAYFTPKKLKLGIPAMNESAKAIIKYIDNLNKKNEQKDAKSIAIRYTVRNVSAAGFDIKANDRLFNLFENTISDSLANLKSTLTTMMPDVGYFLRIRLLPLAFTEYFIRTFRELLKERISKGINREDYMNVLIAAYKRSVFTEEDVVAQAFTLYGDGTETSSQTISTVLYELALNPEKQEKLKEEIDEKLTGELTYELLQEMKYLDCVLNEAQRLHPAFPVLTKVCTKAFKLPPVNKDGTGKEVVLEPGSPVFIPIKAFHLDPNYYPDAEKFHPERFLDGSKDHPWLAFGDGPRMCLGMRFAILQIKVFLVHLVNNFKIKLNSKTTVPLQDDPTPLVESIRGGIWLDFESRVTEN